MWKWVMGIVSKQIKEIEQEKIESINSNVKLETNLTSEELEYLFKLIKKSNFPGADLQVIYKIIIKLQNQYLILTSNKK
jgi:hypothetical protein